MSTGTANANLRTLNKRSQRRNTAIAVGAAVLATAVITAVLHGRVAVETETRARAPMPVASATFAVQDSYRREISFLGVVRAGSISRLGFEVAGAVAELSVREGTPVEAGDVLASLDTAQLQARRAAVAADRSRVEAELELARIKAKRQRDLQKTGAVSEEAFDETRLRAEALVAQLESVDAQLRGIDIDLEKSVLVAPYAGVVAERLVDVGAVVNTGTPVLRLVAGDGREAHIGIAAEQTGLLEEGKDYTLVLRGAPVNARLRSIRPDVDPLTLTTTAVFELPAAAAGLDGEPVRLSLDEDVQVAGGWLPMTALIEGERGLWSVLRLEASSQGTVAVREVVEVLAVQGDRVFVRGSLADRAHYIVEGVHRVAPGTPVEPLEA